MIFKWVTCCEVLKTLHLKWLNDFDKTTKNNPTVYRKTCEFHPVRYLHHEDNGLIVSVDQKKKSSCRSDPFCPSLQRKPNSKNRRNSSTVNSQKKTYQQYVV